MNERVPSPPSLFFKNARRQKRQTIVNLIRNLTARPIAFFRAIEIIGTGGPPREPYLPQWFRQELTIPWHFVFPRNIFAGSDDNLNRRPAVLYSRSQPKPVHGARHVNVGDDNSDVVSRLEDLNSLIGIGWIGIGCRNYSVTGIFEDRAQIRAEECLVLYRENNRHY